MAVPVPPRSRRALPVVPRSAWVALAWVAALLLAAAVLVACGAATPPDLSGDASYWRWQLPLPG